MHVHSASCTYTLSNTCILSMQPAGKAVKYRIDLHKLLERECENKKVTERKREELRESKTQRKRRIQREKEGDGEKERETGVGGGGYFGERQ